MSGPAPPGAGMLTRYGLNQAWNSRLRLCDSSTRKASGSQPGSWPRTPVSHSDHGSYGEGQKASAVGRTCTMTAVWLSRWARSSQARYSALRVSSSSPCRLGQSMLTTLAIHIARNWRLGVYGLVTQVVVDSASWDAGVSVALAGAPTARNPTIAAASAAAGSRRR